MSTRLSISFRQLHHQNSGTMSYGHGITRSVLQVAGQASERSIARMRESSAIHITYSRRNPCELLGRYPPLPGTVGVAFSRCGDDESGEGREKLFCRHKTFTDLDVSVCRRLALVTTNSFWKNPDIAAADQETRSHLFYRGYQRFS
jgi:hypothetical protein